MKTVTFLQPAWILCFSVLTVCAQPALSASGYGETFDTGKLMIAPSKSAPEQLGWASFMAGDWTVRVSDHRSGDLHEYSGEARIRWMNRGHGLLEEFHASAQTNQDDSVQTHDTLFMLAFASSAGEWNLGMVDSLAEDVTLFNGHQLRNQLVLTHAERTGGGLTLIRYNLIISPEDDSGFSISLSQSVDDGLHWTPVYKRQYQSAPDSVTRLNHNPGHRYGLPSPERAPESAQFDFLIGEWNSAHDMTLPTGQTVQFPVNSTAVHKMNGHAIMEYSWYNVDPSLPEAATTIVRIYNRAMRRWESLFVTNRANSMLHFGGTQHGDDIVLTNFGIDSRAPSVPNYVFHSIEEDNYKWLGRNTSDRGRNWNTFWTIEFTRKSPAD